MSATCKSLNMNRRLFYKWMSECPEFREGIEDAKEALVDLAETKLQQNIMEGRELSIFFFLKTQGKNRGYVETVEQKIQVSPFEELMKNLPDEPEKEEPDKV